MVVEHQEDALVGLEALEATLQLVAVGDEMARVGRPGVDPLDVRLDRPALARPFRFLVAGVDEQSSQPGIEAIGVTQGGDVTPREDERLLRGVLGPISVGEDEPGDGVELVDREADKLRERLVS